MSRERFDEGRAILCTYMESNYSADTTAPFRREMAVAFAMASDLFRRFVEGHEVDILDALPREYAP
ncbi:MAG: hypothetical protein ACSHWQ_01300 [Spongiibacteraceae bacterium]